jgi:hypothetical protein
MSQMTQHNPKQPLGDHGYIHFTRNYSNGTNSQINYKNTVVQVTCQRREWRRIGTIFVFDFGSGIIFVIYFGIGTISVISPTARSSHKGLYR